MLKYWLRRSKMNPPTTASTMATMGHEALCCPFGLIEEARTVPAKGAPCSTIPCVALGVQHFQLLRVVYPISWPCLPLSLILLSLPDPFLVSIDSFGVSDSLWFCSPSPPPPRLPFHPLIPSVFFTYCGSVLPSNPLPILSSLDSLFCVSYSLWFYSPFPPPHRPFFFLRFCILHILLAEVVRNSGAFASPMPLYPAREADKVVRGWKRGAIGEIAALSSDQVSAMIIAVSPSRRPYPARQKFKDFFVAVVFFAG